MTEKQQSFWTTLPGILTGVAAIITAITGLYLAIGRNHGAPDRAIDPEHRESAEIAERISEIAIEAIDFQSSTNVAVAGSAHGEGFIRTDPKDPYSGTSVEYDITFPNTGRYRLHIKYAAASSRPIEITFNKKVITDKGLRETTGGWGEGSTDWELRWVGAVNAKAGNNKLKLYRKDPFPHIQTIKFVPID